jgi:hypothetical protein
MLHRTTHRNEIFRGGGFRYYHSHAATRQLALPWWGSFLRIRSLYYSYIFDCCGLILFSRLLYK